MRNILEDIFLFHFRSEENNVSLWMKMYIWQWNRRLWCTCYFIENRYWNSANWVYYYNDVLILFKMPLKFNAFVKLNFMAASPFLQKLMQKRIIQSGKSDPKITIWSLILMRTKAKNSFNWTIKPEPMILLKFCVNNIFNGQLLNYIDIRHMLRW